MSEKGLLSPDAAFELLSYLVSSAQLLLHEPAAYGSLRLVDAASRLARLAAEEAPGESQAFLQDLHARIEEGKVLLMSDQEAYAAFLDEVVRKVARELRRRNMEAD